MRLGDGDLLGLGVAAQLNDLETVPRRRRDPGRLVRRRDEEHPGQVEGQLDERVVETVVLRRVEHLEQYPGRAGGELVDLVEHEDRVPTNDVSAGLDYIRTHPEISNVLLTGGDPLLMSTRRLREILEALAEIDHVRIVRIGSKMPAFDPWRLRRDPELQRLLASHPRDGQRLYLMAHFDHPRELTAEALAELEAYAAAGVTAVNQCPLVRGINDDPVVLAELWSRLSYAGCPPYYLFQGRPSEGNAPYEIPIVAGWRIFQQALCSGSGLARRAKFVMSHATGKIEILAIDHWNIYLRYHQAKNPADLRPLPARPAGRQRRLARSDWATSARRG